MMWQCGDGGVLRCSRRRMCRFWQCNPMPELDRMHCPCKSKAKKNDLDEPIDNDNNVLLLQFVFLCVLRRTPVFPATHVSVLAVQSNAGA